MTTGHEAANSYSARERVKTAVTHREPDRVPIDFWATPEVRRVLKRRLGIDEDEALLQHLGVDFRVLAGPIYRGPALQAADGIATDIWGVPRRTVTFGDGDHRGSYQELAGSPLAGMTSVAEIDRYPGWPSADWWDYSALAEDCRRSRGACVVFVGDRTDRAAQLKPAMYLRGIEQTMLDLSLCPELIECIIAHITAYYAEFLRRVFTAAEGGIDIFLMGDDFGTQSAPLVSPAMWDHFFARGFQQYIDEAHRHGIAVMHHSCGSVRPLIPRFIDAGLDILQSLQPRAAGMELAGLKRDFGADLALHGSVDIQQTLPYGTPADVEAEVQSRMDAGKPGGGFIICTAHNIQADTPVDNVLALIDAYHRYGAY